jgi:hypothetical protein
MLDLPKDIHIIIHDFLKLPSSITITNQDIKDSFVDNRNLKMVLYTKKDKDTFLD